MRGLEDKVAIITGSGRGMGKEYAIRFSQERAKVALAEIDFERAKYVENEIRTQGGDALAIRTDISDEKDVRDMVKEVHKQFGRIDVLVNNAAIIPGFTPAEELKVEEWDRILKVNVTGQWLCCKEVIPYMKQQEKGKIINISSDDVWLGIPGLLHYCCSKGAVIAMTRTLATEWGQYGINVNCVAPGLTMTESGLRQTVLVPDLKDTVIRRQAIKRLEQPTDLVGCVLFLASEESDFITGQTICVNGGLVFY